MATYEIKAPDGQVYEVNAPDTASETEVLAYAKSQFSATPTQKPVAKKIGDNLRDIPRQLGLTGRYLAEPVAGMIDMLGAPIRYGLNEMGLKTPALSETVDKYFPQPQGANERLIGDISKGVVSAALPLKMAQAVKPASMAGKNIQAILTANPATQGAIGGVASGAAGSVREAGGSQGEQLTAALAAGLATPFATGAAGRLAASLPKPSINIDLKINNALRDTGVKFGDLSPAIQQSIKTDVASAIEKSPNLSKDALKRLIDYKVTGATPRTAQLTLSPTEITRQKNLAKMGANSNDPAAQRLAMIENENNQILLNKVDELGASRANIDNYSAGQNVYDDIANYAQSAKSDINNLYGQAKQIDGRLAEFDSPTFINTASKNLERDLATKYLPKEIKSIMNDISMGRLPLNIQVSEQLKTTLATAQRGAVDGNVRKAISGVRDALENTPLRPNQQLGEDALAAFNQARAANLKFKKFEEATPALKSVNEGVDVDNFFDKQVLRSTSRQFENMLNIVSPQTKDQLKADMLGYIKSKATNGQPNETAKISGDMLEKTLKSIGTNKLKLLFTPDELTQLNSIGRVAKYEVFQPVGSAVNNSNTASAAVSAFERMAQSSLLGKVPFGVAAVKEPLQNIVLGSQASKVLNPSNALALPQQMQQTNKLPLLPYAGLLSNE